VGKLFFHLLYHAFTVWHDFFGVLGATMPTITLMELIDPPIILETYKWNKKWFEFWNESDSLTWIYLLVDGTFSMLLLCEKHSWTSRWKRKHFAKMQKNTRKMLASVWCFTIQNPCNMWTHDLLHDSTQHDYWGCEKPKCLRL